MAKKKAQRTTLRSSTGTKLYAVRKADGTFKDIQTYKRAHGQDIKRHSAAEMAVHEGTKVEPAPGVTLPGMPIPIPTPGSSHGSPITSSVGSVAHNAKAGTTKSGASTKSVASSKKPELVKAVKPVAKKAAMKKPAAAAKAPVKKAAPKKTAKKAAPVKKAKKK
jgi:hypothetical protein